MLVFDEETKESAKPYRIYELKKEKMVFSRRSGLLPISYLNCLKPRKSELSEEFRHLAFDLTHPEEFTLPPLKVEATLRDYQETGVKWISMFDRYGFGGILADDMGLGKTLKR